MLSLQEFQSCWAEKLWIPFNPVLLPCILEAGMFVHHCQSFFSFQYIIPIMHCRVFNRAQWQSSHIPWNVCNALTITSRTCLGQSEKQPSAFHLHWTLPSFYSLHNSHWHDWEARCSTLQSDVILLRYNVAAVMLTLDKWERRTEDIMIICTVNNTQAKYVSIILLQFKSLT